MTKPTMPVPEVLKPTLTGSWHGKDAVRLGWKMMLSTLFITFFYLVLSMLLSFNSVTLRIGFGIMLVLAGASYMFYNGVSAGQADAAYGEIMYQRVAEGKPVSEKERARCYHPAKGFFAAVMGATPYMLLAFSLALLAVEETYSLGALPGWLTAYTRQSGMGDALAYYREPVITPALLISLRVAVRSMVMPVINVAVLLGKTAILWAERLSPIWVMLAPLGFGFGYRAGIRQRIKINTGIAIGDQRKKKRERKERRARQKRETPDRLI